MDNSTQQAFLVFQKGPSAGKKVSLNKVPFIIGRGGRNSECDMVLPERQVSRQHAEIYMDRGRYFLRDLGSKNGTFVNGQLVNGAVEIADNDEIQIALCEHFRFVGADATLPLSEIMPTHRLRLDHQARRVWIGSTELDPPLSPAQYKLLELLYQPLGQVRTRDEIVGMVWSEAEHEGVTEQAIDALVRRLRERLAEIAPDARYVVTVRGHGFRLDPSGGG
jgi:hypothetical protein